MDFENMLIRDCIHYQSLIYCIYIMIDMNSMPFQGFTRVIHLLVYKIVSKS